MRECGRGTIINVGAGVEGLTVPGIGVYTGSKFALQSMSDALHQEVSTFGVDVVVVEPGVVAIDFYDRAAEEAESINRTPAYADLYHVLDDIRIVERGGPGINRPERVAEAVLDAASADRPKTLYGSAPPRRSERSSAASFEVAYGVRCRAPDFADSPAIRSSVSWRTVGDEPRTLESGFERALHSFHRLE